MISKKGNISFVQNLIGQLLSPSKDDKKLNLQFFATILLSHAT